MALAFLGNVRKPFNMSLTYLDYLRFLNEITNLIIYQ